MSGDRIAANGVGKNANKILRFIHYRFANARHGRW